MAMKRVVLLLALLPLFCTGCMTRIVTMSPDTGNYGSYSTSVTIPKKHTVVTTTRAIAASEDISLYLDLQAVAAAFAQSSSVQEFERMLNNASYMLSNLDLNRDGYVDYLRVLETVEGRAHVFLIQAVLARNIYQDVATVVAEVSGVRSAYVQVIGSEYLYGPRFIIQPTYITIPAIFAHLCKQAYRPWSSPWYWDHFPSYYKHPAPVYLSHYQAYITTFMTNHKYCHDVVYVNEIHYPDYDRVSRPVQRRDYEVQHPERSFKERTADISTAASTATRPTASRETTATREASAARETTARETTATREASAARETTATRETNARDVRARQDAETVTTVRTTGRSATTNASSSREAGQPSAQSRSARTSGEQPAATQNQTTVRSRVSNSGSTDTKIQTVSPSGTTTTTRRGSADSGSSRRNSDATPATSSSRSGASASPRR